MSEIMWCRDLTQCLTTTDGPVIEAVKGAEDRCFEVQCIIQCIVPHVIAGTVLVYYEHQVSLFRRYSYLRSVLFSQPNLYTACECPY